MFGWLDMKQCARVRSDADVQRKTLTVRCELILSYAMGESDEPTRNRSADLGSNGWRQTSESRDSIGSAVMHWLK